MSREDILRMAREAGIEVHPETIFATRIARFANLVAAAEREQCAKVCEGEYEAADCVAAIRARGEA